MATSLRTFYCRSPRRVAVTIPLVLWACAARPASAPSTPANLPDHFLAGTAAPNSTRTGTVEPESGQDCRNPMVDPRDGARLGLGRSAAGNGDYEVPKGGYGLRDDELLRRDCGSGRVVGVVRR